MPLFLFIYFFNVLFFSFPVGLGADEFYKFARIVVSLGVSATCSIFSASETRHKNGGWGKGWEDEAMFAGEEKGAKDDKKRSFYPFEMDRVFF